MPTCTGFYAKIHGISGYAPITFWARDPAAHEATWTNFLTDAALFNSAFAPAMVNYIGIEMNIPINEILGVATITVYDNNNNVFASNSLKWTAGAKWKKWTFTSNLGTSCITPLAVHSSGTTGPMPNTPPP